MTLIIHAVFPQVLPKPKRPCPACKPPSHEPVSILHPAGETGSRRPARRRGSGAALSFSTLLWQIGLQPPLTTPPDGARGQPGKSGRSHTLLCQRRQRRLVDGRNTGLKRGAGKWTERMGNKFVFTKLTGVKWFSRWTLGTISMERSKANVKWGMLHSEMKVTHIPLSFINHLFSFFVYKVMFLGRDEPGVFTCYHPSFRDVWPYSIFSARSHIILFFFFLKQGAFDGRRQAAQWLPAASQCSSTDKLQ